jgi:DNA-directed RNA polymerase specialized sigma24 family protein
MMRAMAASSGDPGDRADRAAPAGRLAANELELLVPRVIAGDPAAWQHLALHGHALALAICRRRRLGGGAAAVEDLHRDVAERTLGRLRESDHAALRRFVAARERYPSTTFVHWLAAVVGNTYIDVLRSLPEFQRRRQAAARELVRIEIHALDPDSSDPGGRDPAAAAELRRIIACLGAADFPADQRRALLLWLEGNDASEIAEELALAGPKEAGRLLHAARERLRRRFRERDDA